METSWQALAVRVAIFEWLRCIANGCRGGRIALAPRGRAPPPWVLPGVHDVGVTRRAAVS